MGSVTVRSTTLPFESHGKFSEKSTAGFVQILVLIALATISAAVTAMIVTSRSTSTGAGAFERIVRGDTIARSAFLRLTVSPLNSGDDLATRALQADGNATVDIAGLAVGVHIESEDGKIDVLRGDLRLLDRYLENAGVTAAARQDLLEAVDGARMRQDSESALEALTVALLGHVSNGDLDRDLTRFGTQSGVNPSNASDRVLAAIPDLSGSELAELTASRQRASQLGITSQYFTSDSRRLDLIATIHWSASEYSTARLPVEITAAGRLIPLAGPS